MKKYLRTATKWLFAEREFVCGFSKVIMWLATATLSWNVFLMFWAGPGNLIELESYEVSPEPLAAQQWVPPGKIFIVAGAGPIDQSSLETNGAPTVRLERPEDFAAVAEKVGQSIAGFAREDGRAFTSYLAKDGDVWFSYRAPVNLPDVPNGPNSGFLKLDQATLRHEGNLVLSAKQQKAQGKLFVLEAFMLVVSVVMVGVGLLFAAVGVFLAEMATRWLCKKIARGRLAASAAA